MRAIGIILAGGNNNRMRELSNKRAIAAMPIAGSYRDFIMNEARYARLAKANPERAEKLFAAAEENAKARYEYLVKYSRLFE